MILTVPPQLVPRLQSISSWVRNMPRKIGLWLFVGLLSAGCGVWGNDSVKVKIIFTDTNPMRRLTNVSVIVGSDKYFWHHITTGTVETVTLMPDPKDDRQMTLLYTLDGKQKSWDSPKFNVGEGYRIEIKIDSDGAITHRYCILPCRLD